MNNERLMVMRNKIENVGLEDCGVDGGLVGEIIDELIDSRHKIETLTAQLLAIRDAGDEEVERLRRLACNLAHFQMTLQETQECYEHIEKLRDIAISRGQQIRERDAEIERLLMAVGLATTIKGDMVMRADDPLGMMQEVCQYVATLTTERGEARELLRELWTAIPPGVINQDRDWVRSVREIVEGK